MKYLKFLFILIIVLNSCKNNEKEKSVLTENILIAKAKKIHKRIITLDTHNDIKIKNFTDSINYTPDLDKQLRLPTMTEGSLQLSWLSIYH